MKQNKEAVALRKYKAIEMRVKGKSYKEIADELGYKTEVGVYKLIQKGLKDAIKENVPELIAMGAMELDMIKDAWMEKAMEGDAKAAKVLMDVFDRRCKLLKMIDDAPEVVVENNINLTWDD